MVSYMELLPRLLQNQLIARVSIEPHKPLYTRWYDPNNQYDYHCGTQAHSTKNCLPLKYKVQSLIKVYQLEFNRNNGLNVTANPLPNHVGPNINAVMEELGIRINI